MRTLYNKKYFFLLLINIFLIIASNYSYASDNDDTIDYTLNGEKFIKKLPESILNFYKKDPMTFYVPGNEIFSEPLQLLILQDLLKNTIQIFNKFKIDFWITENTLLEYLRFNSFAPWADNATIAIDYNSMKKDIKNIIKEFKKQGIEFDLFDRITTLQHIPYLRFTPQKFFNVVKKHDPSLSLDEITKKYDQLKYQLIQIDLYPFAISESGGYNLIEYLHDSFIKLGGNKNGYKIKDIYPLQKVKLNDIVVNSIKNPYAILDIKQDLNAIYSVYAGKTLCTNSSPIKIKDMRKHYEFLDIINNFLAFTFKGQFHGMSTTYQDILNSLVRVY